jgi:hypothetical protein
LTFEAIPGGSAVSQRGWRQLVGNLPLGLVIGHCKQQSDEAIADGRTAILLRACGVVAMTGQM